jgi:hypothetical protein
MPDFFAEHTPGLHSPGIEMFLITPSATPLDPPTRAIRADAAGSVTLRAVNSATAVTVNMVAGEILPVRAAVVSAATMTVHGIA